MVMNDPIANMFSNILNAEKAGKKEIVVEPISKLALKILEILQDLHYVGEFKCIKNGKGGIIKINLLGNVNRCGVVKPRFPVKKDNYKKFEKRFLPAKDFGVLIVSTSKGLMTHNKAQEENIGGRLVAFCY